MLITSVITSRPGGRRRSTMAALRSSAAGLVLLVCAPGAVWAQSGTTVVAGTVRDVTGQPVPEAHVRLEEPATGRARTLTTDASGRYEFADVRPATPLSVDATVTGFQPARRAVDALSAGERRVVDLHLAPAGVSEVIDVRADAPLGRSSTPVLGGRLTRDQVEQVPVNGRDLVALAYLVPGAAPARGFYNLAPRLTINGASSLATNYTADGFDNTDLFLGGPKVPVTVGSTDSLQVLVNAYSAEYGRTGNGVFAVTTRAGTNTHRGAALYTVRPGAVLDAPNHFAPRDASGEVVDDSFRRHQGGASVGGPLRTNRVFYFGDVEVTRERQDAILTSPLAVGLAPTRFDSQTGVAKLDVQWTDRQATTLRYHGSDYTHDNDLGFIGGLTLPSAGLRVNYRNAFASASHRSLFGAGVNEFGLQVGRLRANWQTLDPGPRVIVTDRGATRAVLGGVSDDFFWTETDLQVRNAYTQQVGRHTLRIGGDLLTGDFFIDSGPTARGLYVVDLEGRPVTPSGDFVTRDDIPRDVQVLSYTQSFVNPQVRDRQTLAALFVEDTLRVSADTTVTAGVRWDYDSVTSTPAGEGDWNNLAPRVGVTWTPRGSARHQVRAGYGVFYERIPFAVRSDTLFNAPSNGAVSVTFAPGTPFAPPAFPSTLPGDAFGELPTSELPPRNVQVFDPNLRSPWTMQGSAGYVWSPLDDLAVSVDYVHSVGRNLIRRVDTNAPASVQAGAQRSVADADGTRPIVPAAGGFRLIEEDQSSGRSTFDGLYVNARKRLRQRFAVDVAYTWSRVQNDTDDINFRPVDSREPEAEFGPSLNDRRHVLAIDGLVQLPWRIDVAPVVFLSTGQPLNVTTGRDDNGDTVFNDRPANVARNSERTSGFSQVDLGASRRFAIGATSLELRADVFNAFNRTNFSGFFNWGASGVRPDEQGTLAFQPTQAGPARQFQFTFTLRY